MKELVCIVCPAGCKLKIENDGELKISGNKCKRGKKFALDEITAPMRSISSTVKTAFPDVPVLPVRVSKDIPKDKIFDVMKEINKLVLKKRLGRGEVIIPNVLGLDADIIATSDILIKQQEEVL